MAKEKKKYRHSSSYYRKIKKAKANYKDVQSETSEEINCELASTSGFQGVSTLYVSFDPDTTHTSKDFLPSDNIDEKSDDEEICSNKESENEDSGDEYVTNKDYLNMKLVEDLREWTVQHKPTKSSLNDLLAVLSKYGFKLPKDGRALLKTDDVFIEPMGQGNIGPLAQQGRIFGTKA
ncbi:uncharacterized protein LOC125231855 [Leguminivora glycinivorella]|uniref:uncharacterized protein LOC125231855 n=1 Tax=Leguminivora glycinivorella TaxID=1035111 RepID=UPI00200E4425|nr:uncharacterized protein LOC125231855 [Leguminivora glycinivorella]